MPIILIGILGGTLLAAGLKALFDIGSTVSANKYNAPKAQLKRLRQAGLPLAYMYQGKVATQQNVPELSIDPHLGTLASQQGKYIKLQAEDLSKDIQVKDLIAPGQTQSNRYRKAIADADIKGAEAFIKKYEKELKAIEVEVENTAFKEGIQVEAKRQALEKAKQQIENLLAQAGLMDQLKKIRGFEELLNSSLTQDIESMPQWISSLLKIILLATKR